MQPQAWQSALELVLVELEAEAGHAGWDQPARLFGLVSSDLLLDTEPELAAELGLRPGTLTAIEQDGFDVEHPLDQLLPLIEWPEGVVGAAVILERLVLPDDAGPTGASAASGGRDPRATDVRLVVGAARDGADFAVVRVRGHEELIRQSAGEQLVPGLAKALARSLAP
ncbi:MAG: hypothetical protein E6Q90_03995 [Actinobacteria bacterium]|nr:MAG: hypothetical protein E6Q90_03995 [Actinomycetota bacterium]